MLQYLGKFLKNPVTILSSALLGVFIGVNFPGFTEIIAPFGALFLAMLQMVALPIILCAVISGLGSLLHAGLAGETMKRFGVILIAGPLFAATLSLVSGVLTNPGIGLPEDAQLIFGTMMSEENEINMEGAEAGGFWVFANQIVPDNIFVSLVDGRSLQVLFFSILVGIALGLDKRKSNETTLAVIESVFDALLRIINWLIYLLPFGLCALLASQVENINASAMVAMLKLALVYIGTCIILFIVCNAVIAYRTRTNIFSVINALREPLFVAAGSSNPFAALPSALRGLQFRLKVDGRIADLMTPLALNLLPLATIMYFSIASLFIAQISGIDLSGKEYVVLFFGSIFAGLAAASLPSAAGVAVIALVLEPLGLPVGVAVVLLIAIDPLMEPFNSAADVNVACAVTALVAPPPGQKNTTKQTDSTNQGRRRND